MFIKLFYSYNRTNVIRSRVIGLIHTNAHNDWHAQHDSYSLSFILLHAVVLCHLSSNRPYIHPSIHQSIRPTIPESIHSFWHLIHLTIGYNGHHVFHTTLSVCLSLRLSVLQFVGPSPVTFVTRVRHLRITSLGYGVRMTVRMTWQYNRFKWRIANVTP